MTARAYGTQRLSNRRFAAWLSLFALLLIYLGPLLSQARGLQPMSAEPTTQAHHTGTANTLAHGPERTPEYLPKHASEHPGHLGEHGAAHEFEYVSAQSAERPKHASKHPPEHASEHAQAHHLGQQLGDVGHAQPEHTKHAGAHHGANSLGDVCGYCSLLLHSPALGNSASMLGAAACVDPVPIRAQSRIPPRARSTFPDARPRAPPAFS